MDERVLVDEAAGPLIRPYTVTGGRTGTGRVHLDMVTLVVTVPRGLPRRDREGWAGAGELRRHHQPEHALILDLCAHAHSVVEISAHLKLPMAVVKMLVGDLLDQRLVTTMSPATPDLRLLQTVLDGIRRL